MGTFLSILLGGAVTLGVSWWFHRRQSRQLEAKVDRLERLITVMAHYLQKDGVIQDLELDEDHKLKGYTQIIKVNEPARIEVRPGRPTLKQDLPPEDSERATQEE